MMTRSSIWDVPIGANKQFLVTCDGRPFAGFDELRQANLYVTMQKNKRKKDGGPTVSAGKDWGIENRG